MGVLFGDYHSYDDFELLQKSHDIGAAEPKITSIEVPGASEPLDLTEYFGSVLYNERTIKFVFYLIKPRSECIRRFTEIRNLLDGIRMDVVWDEDSEYKYNGRVKITAYMDGAVGMVEAEILCNPYKLRTTTTTISASIDEDGTVNCYNERMLATPTITVDADMTITFDGEEYFVEADTPYYNDNIVFVQGINVIECDGSGTITIEYQEGAL